jgi:hypothetical protein
MKISKFDTVYKKSYKMFLKEEAPMPTGASDEANPNESQPSPPTKQVDAASEEQINQSQLPDPNDVVGVKTDLLKMFQDFFNSDQQRQEEFKRSIATKSIDSKNAEVLISQMKEFIAAGEKPKQSSI